MSPKAAVCFSSQQIYLDYEALVYLSVAAWDKLGLSLNAVLDMKVSDWMLTFPPLQEIIETERQEMEKAQRGEGA